MLGPAPRTVGLRKAIAHPDEAEVRRIVEQLTKKVRVAMQFAIDSAVSANDEGRLVDVMGRKLTAVDTVTSKVDLADFEKNLDAIKAISGDGFESAGRSALRGIAEDIRLYGPLGERAENYLRTKAADFVVNVTAQTRAAVRSSLVHSFERGLPPRTAAERLRTVIGLNERQAVAVQRFREKMIAEGLPQPVIDRRVNRYVQQKIKERSENIARTELHTAVSAGRQAGWEVAVREEVIQATRFEKKWLTSEDERVCSICQPMNGQQRAIDTPFDTGDGRQVETPGGPTHPSCRCTVVLEKI